MSSSSTKRYAIIERCIFGLSAYFSILEPTGWTLFPNSATKLDEELAFKLVSIFAEHPSFFNYIVMSVSSRENESK